LILKEDYYVNIAMLKPEWTKQLLIRQRNWLSSKTSDMLSDGDQEKSSVCFTCDFSTTASL